MATLVTQEQFDTALAILDDAIAGIDDGDLDVLYGKSGLLRHKKIAQIIRQIRKLQAELWS